ncbi:MAG: DUF4384 domain-containing protein, partial [Gemmatimonadales bacterium]
MHSVALLTLFMPAVPVDLPALATTMVQEPAVQVWLDKTEHLQYGEHLRVYVRTEADGHLVVLHADPEGRVRVLFPLDPFTDDFVRGNRDYEIRNREDHEAITTVGTTGFGTVYVAYSQDPFAYGAFALGDHWDNRVLADVELTGDAERELTEIAQQMASGTEFIYDLQTYYLSPP